MFIFLVIYIKTERLKWFFKEIYHSIIYLVHFINQPRDRALQLLFQKCICFTKHPDCMIKQFHIDSKLFQQSLLRFKLFLLITVAVVTTVSFCNGGCFADFEVVLDHRLEFILHQSLKLLQIFSEMVKPVESLNQTLICNINILTSLMKPAFFREFKQVRYFVQF